MELLIGGFALLAVGIVILLVIASKNKGKPKHKKKKSPFQIKLTRVTYATLKHIPFVGQLVERVTLKISRLAVFPAGDIPGQVIKYMMKSAVWSLAFILAGTIFFSDIITKTLCYIFAVLVFGNKLDKQIDKINLKVLKQTKRLLTSMQQEYLKTKSIPDALSGADAQSLLRRAVDDIHSIIMGSNGEMRLQQFYSAVPFRPLQTLACVCYNLNTFGDTVDKNDESAFIKALTILRSDVDSQIEKIAKQNAAFSMMEYLAMAPVFMIAPLESFFISTIPGTALVYNGILCFVARALTILAGIAGYIVVSRINSTVIVKPDDRGTFISKLAAKPRWKRFITALFPKTVDSQKKLVISLQAAMSKMKFEHLYTKKVLAFGVTVIGSLAMFITGITLGRDFARNTTQTLTLASGSDKTEDEIEQIKRMDTIYFEAKGQMSRSQMITLINTYIPNITDMEREDEIKRMQDKYNSWVSLRFEYYYVLLSFAFGFIGYMVPNLILKGRAKFVKTEVEDDFMQLQTLASILMYTNIDTLELLRQMAQHSTVHANILRQAYHNFTSAPELELERLRSKITLPEFKWFIDKVKLTISELPMEEAFADLVSERETFLRLRSITLQASMSKKKAICKMLSMAPVVMVAISEMLLPVGILGLSEFTNTMAML